MTNLDKLVHEQAEGTIISVGSHDGFFFVGTAAEYEEVIDGISGELLNRMQLNAQKNLDYFQSRFATLQAKAAEGISPTPETIKELTTLMSSALKNTAMAARFIPVREREIVGSYKGIREGTWKIIIEGDESGKYWDREEYLADKARRTKKK